MIKFSWIFGGEKEEEKAKDPCGCRTGRVWLNLMAYGSMARHS